MSCTVLKTKIVPAWGSGTSPAKVNRLTGTIFLNEDIWPNLSPEMQKFIIFHEQGHFCRKTKSEIQADKYAFEHFVGTEKESLRKMVRIMDETLDVNKNPDHKKRYITLLGRIFVKDIVMFNQKKQPEIFKKMIKQEYLQSLFVDYLKERGINDIDALSEDDKETLLVDFMNSDEIQEMILADAVNLSESEAEYSEFAGKIVGFFKEKILTPENKEKIGGLIGKVTGNYVSSISSGLNYQPNQGSLNSMISLTSPANNLVASNPMSSGKSKDDGGTPPTESGDSPDQSVTEKKKKTWLLPVIIGVSVIIIGLGIFFITKNR